MSKVTQLANEFGSMPGVVCGLHRGVPLIALAVQSSTLKLNECVVLELLYSVTVPVVAQLNEALILVRIGVMASSS